MGIIKNRENSKNTNELLSQALGITVQTKNDTSNKKISKQEKVGSGKKDMSAQKKSVTKKSTPTIDKYRENEKKSDNPFIQDEGELLNQSAEILKENNNVLEENPNSKIVRGIKEAFNNALAETVTDDALDISPKKEIFAVPEHIREYIKVLDCTDFDEEKYFVTSQVEDIKDIIIKTKSKSHIIQDVVGIAYPNTTLLWGVPGTGKTSLCKYLAHLFNLPFVYLNFSKIFNGVFGKTSGIIADVFDFISEKECIFCIDEIDAISQRRGTEGDVTGGEIGRVTVALMQAIDDLRNKESNAIIIACTNRVEIMDEALRSRFSVERQVKNLTIEEKRRYIERFLKKVHISLLEHGYDKLILDRNNILEYCRGAASYSQRDVEMDLIRCLSLWLDNPQEKYHLDHVQKRT